MSHRVRSGEATRQFSHPTAFWVGVGACITGVALHLPMYLQSRSMGYRLAGMHPDLPMICGMVAIVAGLGLSLYGLMPTGSAEIGRRAAGIRVSALDDALIRRQHVVLMVVMALAVTIDVMKPTTLSFVAPGVAREYGLKTAANPHGHIPVTWLPLAGIGGTVLGSMIWGWLGDRIGRRASILYAGVLFVSTSICGAMPGFRWNLLMCFIMGLGAGGMLPIAFTLIAETIPARHRGWLTVLIGGDIAGAYVITSWLAGSLTPTYSWRILWLLGMPTGVLLILLNRWIPESPRHLLAAGRASEAEAIMRRFGARVEVQPAIAPAASIVGGRVLWRALLRPTIAVTGIALAAGLLTYGFQFWAPTNLQRLGLAEVNSDYVLRNSALIGLPVTAVVAALYGFWSSRKTIALLALVTGAAVLTLVGFHPAPGHDQGLLTALLVIPLAGTGSLVAVIIAYAAEIYPTWMRSSAAGWVAGMTKAGGLLILATVLLATRIPSLATTALVGAVPLALATVLFLATAPETHQLRLEEITETELLVGR